MRRIRIGNDIRIEWNLTSSDNVNYGELPFTVEVRPSKVKSRTIANSGYVGDSAISEGYTIEIEKEEIDMYAGLRPHEERQYGMVMAKELPMPHCLNQKPPKSRYPIVLPYKVEEDTIVATWGALQQFDLGCYDVILYLRKGETGQSVADAWHVIELVASSEEADPYEEGKDNAVVDISPAQVTFTSPSAYDIAMKHGFTGTEDEWLLSLQGKGDTFTIDLLDYTKKTDFEELKETVESKQDNLVSGTNIKTVNGESLLGSGDITIEGSGSDVDTSNYVTKDDLQDAVGDKQDKLISGTNVKTINGKSILGSGDITIEGSGSDVDTSNYVTKDDLQDAVGDKQDKLISGTNVKTINGKSILGSGDITIEGSGSDVDTSNYVTKDDLQDAVGDKQDKLISGTNVKTINGKSILGSGDITIEGSGSGDSGSNTFDTEVDDSMETTADVGNITKGTLCSELKGKTFTEVLEKALFSEIYPTPKYQHTIGLQTLDSPVESGTTITNPTMTAVWNANITPVGTITKALTAKVNNTTVDISSGSYTIEGFNTITYTMAYSYPEGSYEVTSNYGNKKTITVPAVTGKTKTVSVTSTYPWYINDTKQSSLIVLNGQKTIETTLDGQPSIKVPGAGSAISVQVDLGFGYMDVDWTSSTELINGITYATLTKPDSYTTASKHKITITIKK